MRGLDNFKTVKKLGDRNVVPTENAKNLMDYKETKQNSVTRKQHKITHKLITQVPSNLFGDVMTRVKLDHLVATGMIEKKHRRGKQCEKILDGLTRKDWN